MIHKNATDKVVAEAQPDSVPKIAFNAHDLFMQQALPTPDKHPSWRAPELVQAPQTVAHEQRDHGKPVDPFESYQAGSECPTPLTAKEFKESMVRILGKLGNKADNLTIEDLAKLMTDPTIHGRDALALATFYKEEMMARDEKVPIGPNNGLSLPLTSRDDIRGIPETLAQKAPALVQLMAVTNQHNYYKMDKNLDGTLSAAEIAQSDTMKALLTALPDLKIIADAHGGTLNAFDLKRELDKVQAQTLVFQALSITEQSLREKMDGATSHQVFADKNNPIKSIRPEDVHQGHTGDCYFEAALASQAKQDPAAIRDAIKTNADGTFTVTFKGDKTHPVTIAAPTEAELALYNGGSGDGMWPAIMEKAFGQYLVEHHRPADRTRTATDVSEGGFGGPAIQLLTGHESYNLNAPNDQSKTDLLASIVAPIFPGMSHEMNIGKNISEALSAGKLICVDFTQEGGLYGAYYRHEYTVMDCKDGWVTLRNPWGRTGEPGGDIIKMSLHDFAKTADIINVEGNLNIPPLSTVSAISSLG